MSDKIKLALRQHGKYFVFVVLHIEPGEPRFLCKDGTLSLFCEDPNILTHRKGTGGANILSAYNLLGKYEMMPNN